MSKTTNKENGKQLGNFRRMMNYVTPFWQFKAVIALILFSTLLDVQMPMMIGDIIDLIGNISAGKGTRHMEWGTHGHNPPPHLPVDIDDLQHRP